MPIRPCPTAWPSRPTSWQIRSKSSKYVVDTLFTYLMAFRYAPTRPCASRLHTFGYTMLDLWHACKLITKTKQTNKNRCSRDPNDIRLDIPTQGHFHGFILPVRWHAIIYTTGSRCSHYHRQFRPLHGATHLLRGTYASRTHFQMYFYPPNLHIDTTHYITRRPLTYTMLCAFSLPTGSPSQSLRRRSRKKVISIFLV
jgi:hypothetical protein